MLPDSFPPSSSWHEKLRKDVNVALVDYLCQGFYALNTLYGTYITWEFWFTNEISKRRLENALLTEQIERQILFCTVTSWLLHDDVKIHAMLAWLYNVLENWQEMKTVFRSKYFDPDRRPPNFIRYFNMLRLDLPSVWKLLKWQCQV